MSRTYSLRELEARLLRCGTETSSEIDDQGRYVFRDSDGSITMWSTTPERTFFTPVATVAEAHGICFLCPKSFEKNGGPQGTHSVYIFFTGSPHAGRNTAGQEVRWQVIGGSSVDDLQLSPSILEQDEHAPAEWRCGWHGFIGSSGIPAGHAG
jgi:hypothetical protein